ncbi:LOW QUALITY PROTEIN: uncharacterized protein ACR2FA_002868 [Aphomia sociella]
MDLKHEVAYRGLPSQVKAEPGVSHNGHQVNGHVRDWMARGRRGGGSPSPQAAQPQPNNGYSSPLSSSSYGPYSPNGKIDDVEDPPDLNAEDSIYRWKWSLSNAVSVTQNGSSATESVPWCMRAGSRLTRLLC